MVIYAQKATDELKTGVIVSQCKDIKLVYDLRDIYMAHGAADILSNIFPEDEEARKLLKATSDMYKFGNDIKDKFAKECICKKM